MERFTINLLLGRYFSAQRTTHSEGIIFQRTTHSAQRTMKDQLTNNEI
ncbi:MAG: hypothetical protein FWD49_02075 [Firmicutes bacterium]|nr:hypothetical protein [Bacillota bacterium]